MFLRQHLYLLTVFADYCLLTKAAFAIIVSKLDALIKEKQSHKSSLVSLMSGRKRHKETIDWLKQARQFAMHTMEAPGPDSPEIRNLIPHQELPVRFVTFALASDHAVHAIKTCLANAPG